MSRLDVLAGAGPKRSAVDDPARESSTGPSFWDRLAREAAERAVDEIPVGERAVLDTPYSPVVILAGHADGAVRGWPTMRKFFARVGEAIEEGHHGRMLGAAVDADAETWAIAVLPLADDDHTPLLRVVEVFVRQGLANTRGRL